ncbi:VOC family protein [Actinokineospora bangkokensis]|uniref:Glyoxalase n=1 Tax=Actinokineospora bangkokensis TaxID=1193682 RepID=A0A1Q9LEA3_9PSEU|nr:VOC family protein [Actinokineospora bangkokensis]OLR90344.1 glyoxalase [Actinokineospora bangkokensis]
MELTATVLDSRDPRALARFYAALLGWSIGKDDPEWVTLRPAGGGAGLSFQFEPLHRKPSWPSTEDGQQMQTHLDIEVDDLDDAVARVRAAGGAVADFQPQEHVRVCYDPDGHPFCVFTEETGETAETEEAAETEGTD